MGKMDIEKYFKFEYSIKTKIAGIAIDSCEVIRIKIPLNLVFAISLGNQEFYDGVIVKLNSGNTTGYGEAETIAEITGETPEVLFNIATGILKMLNGKKLEGLEDFSESITHYCYGNTAAKSAIDMAFYDLLGKSLGVHVVKITGGSLKPRMTSLTIPIGTKEKSLALLEKYQDSGVSIIKIKVGRDVNEDSERIKYIAEHLRSGVKFFADANQGYNLASAIKISGILQRYEAIFFEQPMNRADLNGARELRHKSGLPIMLDESISTPIDVMNAIRLEAADMINVKLSKSGGIHQAIKTLTVAQAAGIDAMVGCMLESKLGIAASLVVANSVNNVKFTDLDGFTYLSKQPFNGGLNFDKGKDELVNGEGFAVQPNDEFQL
jgi:L-alanine-DL-glutamate epimerase-like enolase superfamily enzyme